MRLLSENSIPFKDQEFDLRFTGEELARLYDLSYTSENGVKHVPGLDDGRERFFGQLARMLPEVNFTRLKCQLKNGKLSE